MKICLYNVKKYTWECKFESKILLLWTEQNKSQSVYLECSKISFSKNVQFTYDLVHALSYNSHEC